MMMMTENIQSTKRFCRSLSLTTPALVAFSSHSHSLHQPETRKIFQPDVTTGLSFYLEFKGLKYRRLYF